MRMHHDTSTQDSFNSVAEFSYRVGIAVVVALVCMILVASLRAGAL